MTGLLKFRAWKRAHPPRHILVIRFQALGDVVITLPYIQSLRYRYPHAEIHFLTRKEDQRIAESLILYDKIIVVRGGRNAYLQFICCMFLMPYLILKGYDVVLDLQNHKISRIIRRLLNAPAWCEFDRSSPLAAGERTRMGIESAGLGPIKAKHSFNYKISTSHVEDILRLHGWDGHSKLIILNPGGAFPSRHWPIENYVAFAKLWLQEDQVQFLMLGLPTMSDKGKYFQERLGTHIINLIGKTDSAEAFRITGQVHFVLTEDGGMMHMAWVQGVPTMALFGSTRSDWSRPLGTHTKLLDSSDLSCGNCMQAECPLGTLHCLTRHTASNIYQHARLLLNRIQNE